VSQSSALGVNQSALVAGRVRDGLVALDKRMWDMRCMIESVVIIVLGVSSHSPG
jgi:hypothetical protein